MCSHLIEMWKIWFWCITFTYCLYSWTLLDSSRDNEANPICWWRPPDTAESSWRNLSKWSLSKFFFFFFFLSSCHLEFDIFKPTYQGFVHEYSVFYTTSKIAIFLSSCVTAEWHYHHATLSVIPWHAYVVLHMQIKLYLHLLTNIT